MVNKGVPGLKGQYNIAQGNPEYSGGVLGWKSGEQIVRQGTLTRAEMFFRTKGSVADNRQIERIDSVREEFFFHENHVRADDFFIVLFTPGVARG